MGMFEEPLLHAIVRAHHDPDPNRAYRYKPFFYDSRREPLAPPPLKPTAARRSDGLSRLIAAVWPWRAVPAPTACCCPAPACSPSC